MASRQSCCVSLFWVYIADNNSTSAGRILRFLASIHVVDNYGPDLFVANNATKAMASPQGVAALAHLYVYPRPSLSAPAATWTAC